MTQSTDALPPDCLSTAALTAYMGWASTSVARTLNSKAKRRREAGTSSPSDLPAPDGYTRISGRTGPYWRKTTIDEWRGRRLSAIRAANDPEAQVKKCSKCREVKPYSQFNTYQDRRTDPPVARLTAKCKSCHKAVAEAWNASNVDRRRATARLHARTHRRRYRAQKYGLTEAQLAEMETAQGGRCLICREKPDRLVIDHCHASGVVRGLLCDSCNKGLGSFRDHPGRLMAAALYLTGVPAAS